MLTGKQTLKAAEQLRAQLAKVEPLRSRAAGGLIEHLSEHPRELLAVSLVFGVYGFPRSYGMVAEQLGVSKNRAVQLVDRGLARLDGKPPRRAAISKTLGPSPAQRELALAEARLERIVRSQAQLAPPSTPGARRSRIARRQAAERRVTELRRGGG